MATFGSLMDPASQFKVVQLAAQAGTAAGAGDNTEITSAGIDRKPQGLGGFDSMIIALGYLTTVASAQTLKVTVKISESDDGSTWGADSTLVNAQTLETGVVTAKSAAYELGLDLRARKRYVRFKLTMDLSAAGTDTFVYGATAVLAAASVLPQ